MLKIEVFARAQSYHAGVRFQENNVISWLFINLVCNCWAPNILHMYIKATPSACHLMTSIKNVESNSCLWVESSPCRICCVESTGKRLVLKQQ